MRMATALGLLGILIGEQVVPVANRLLSGEPVNTSWLSSECAPHVLGELPSGPRSSPQRIETPT